MSTIVIVEDEEIICNSLCRLMARQGHTTLNAATIAAAQQLLQQHSVDLIITDIRLPDGEGTTILTQAVPDIPVIVMTSYSSVASAVEAMRLGAADYIAKPFHHDEMVLVVARVLAQQQLQLQNASFKQIISRSEAVHGISGKSSSIQQLCQQINKVAPTNSTILITGESGSGKELVARAIHKQSSRANEVLIAINCAAIATNLLESELFGHEKGAFTGATQKRQGLIEAADGGTLFLDEIGELPLEAQSRLLRVLQEGEIRRVGSNTTRNVNIRLLAATHRDLQQMVTKGSFREDLFYRLHVITLQVPPLRDRGKDVLLLAEQKLQQLARQHNRPPQHFSNDAKDALQGYHWPGNVRELHNMIERAVILSDKTEIDCSDLALQCNQTEANTSHPYQQSLDDYFAGFVRHHQQTLSETEIAAKLGINRKTLWEKRHKLAIPRPKS